MNKYKVVHVGYYHSADDIRIIKKECMTLHSTGVYDLTYITSDRNSTHAEQENNEIYIKILPLVDKRFVRLFRYIKDLKKQVISMEPDVCHIHEFVLYPIISKLKKRKIKVVLDFHENDIEVWRDKFEIKYGKIISKMFFLLISYYEKKCVKLADAIIVVDRRLEERIKKYGKTPILIPNYPIVLLETETVDYKNHEENVCFAGGYSDTWSIKKIMMALNLVPKAGFLLAGFGEKEYLDDLKKYESWNKTKYYGKISHDMVQQEIYGKSRIGLALLKYDKSWSEGPLGNTKLFEYMLAGLPVVCTDFPIWKEIVEYNNCGICVEPDNIEDIATAVSYILENEEKAAEMGENGRKLVMEKYNWNVLGKELKAMYKKLLS